MSLAALNSACQKAGRVAGSWAGFARLLGAVQEHRDRLDTVTGLPPALPSRRSPDLPVRVHHRKEALSVRLGEIDRVEGIREAALLEPMRARMPLAVPAA